jgi:hypothetical protein
MRCIDATRFVPEIPRRIQVRSGYAMRALGMIDFGGRLGINPHMSSMVRSCPICDTYESNMSDWHCAN